MKNKYSSPEDIEVCRAIHKKFGTTYYYATLRFPDRIRWRVHGLYAFVRIADEWVDNPGTMTIAEQRAKLADWRTQLMTGIQGQCPEHPAMRVFCDVVRECRMPMEEIDCFLDAMETDLDKTRYETYGELQQYMRGSASAIGVLMCYAMCARTDPDTIARAKALGEAMQLTNFLRDIREDFARGRIYIPQEDLRRFHVTEEDLGRRQTKENFRALMKFEIERTRALYGYSDPGINKLPDRVRNATLLARLLYSQILGRIEAQHYDVFSRRAQTNTFEKLVCAVKVAIGSRRILDGLLEEGTAK